MISSLRLLVYAVFAIAAQSAGYVAPAQATSISIRKLDGTSIQFPATFAGHPTVLQIGFDRASREQTEVWARKLAKLSTPPTRDIYQVSIVDSEGVMNRLKSNISRWMDSDASRSNPLLVPKKLRNLASAVGTCSRVGCLYRRTGQQCSHLLEAAIARSAGRCSDCGRGGPGLRLHAVIDGVSSVRIHLRVANQPHLTSTCARMHKAIIYPQKPTEEEKAHEDAEQPSKTYTLPTKAICEMVGGDALPNTSPK